MYGVFHLRIKKKKGAGKTVFRNLVKFQKYNFVFDYLNFFICYELWILGHPLHSKPWFLVHLNCLHQHRTELILVANYLCHIKYAKSIRSTFDSRFTQVDGHARAQALILSFCIAISSRNLHVTIQTQCAVHKNVTAFVGYISIPFLDQTKYKDISFLLLLTTRFVHLQFSLKVWINTLSNSLHPHRFHVSVATICELEQVFVW